MTDSDVLAFCRDGCTDGYLPDWRTGNPDGYARSTW